MCHVHSQVYTRVRVTPCLRVCVCALALHTLVRTPKLRAPASRLRRQRGGRPFLFSSFDTIDMEVWSCNACAIWRAHSSDRTVRIPPERSARDEHPKRVFVSRRDSTTSLSRLKSPIRSVPLWGRRAFQVKENVTDRKVEK